MHSSSSGRGNRVGLSVRWRPPAAMYNVHNALKSFFHIKIAPKSANQPYYYLALDSYPDARIGNTMGLSSLELLEQRLTALEGQFLYFRRPILDEWSGNPRSLSEVQERNTVARGNITMDIRAIADMIQEDPFRA
ncbi:hypothetical protein CBS147332_3601 [Penicillium roqueforti]|nr:hypothetical protein CBS147332_3601 [Penicillium roqueforti]KAI3117389.1 hypothetical protein CBS147331_3864 [Penicillium roqueforti]